MPHFLIRPLGLWGLFVCFNTLCGVCEGQEVKSVGEMRWVMMGQDLGAHLLWDTVPRAHLFGLGPLGRIAGEVTVLDGRVFTSTVDRRGRIRLREGGRGVYAPFGVYAHVPAWESFALEVSISSEEELQAVVAAVAEAQGYDLAVPFPFRITGMFEEVQYHVISKPKGEKAHNHELHHKAKRHFSLRRVEGELLGFYSRHDEGIYTHRGSYIHVHFVDAARTQMGHLEAVALTGKATLMLPAR